jgi:hypothetical protein
MSALKGLRKSVSDGTGVLTPRALCAKVGPGFAQNNATTQDLREFLRFRLKAKRSSPDPLYAAQNRKEQNNIKT